jgi:nucleotide-binding universal stress UspA family protein
MSEGILVPLDGSNSAEIVLPYVIEIVARSGADIMIVSVSESATDTTTYMQRVSVQVKEDLKEWGAPEIKVNTEVLVGKPELELLRYAGENNISLIAMASRGASSQTQWLLGSIAAKVLRASRHPVLLIREAAHTPAIEEKRLIRRILVPLDGSEIGEAAIPSVVALVQALGTELILFQAIAPIRVSTAQFEDSWVAINQKDEEVRRNTTAGYLEEVAKPLRESGFSVSMAIGSGSPADQIIDYAEANTIDLIAMSTHGRSGIGRWVFGSVTDKVLHAGNKAVFVVRATS